MTINSAVLYPKYSFARFIGLWVMFLVTLSTRAGQLLPITQIKTGTFNNAYVIGDPGHLQPFSLIDTGEKGDTEQLITKLSQHGFKPENLQAVILTHGHHDHAGGARALQTRYNVPVYVGYGDHSLVTQGINDTLCPTGFLGKVRHHIDAKQTYPPLETTLLNLIASPETIYLPNSTVPIRLIPLAGHTSGSVIIVIEDEAIIGDILRGKLIGHGVAEHLYHCDRAKSLSNQAFLLDLGVKRFYPGHFGAFNRTKLVTLYERLR